MRHCATVPVNGGVSSAPGAGGWEQAASRLKEARPGRERDEACRGLADVLARVVGPAPGDSHGLKWASRALAALLADLDYDTCAGVLAESVGRAYVVSGNCGSLGALFDEIYSSLDGDNRTRVMLEAVRASLLCTYVKADELGDSVKDALGSCYDALAGVARNSGLGTLSGLMGREGAREAACSGRSGVARMSRLWRLVCDMCDVPDGTEINDALGRYDALRSVSGKKRLREAKARISQFLLHIALDHAVHRDYETIYTVTAESNMRIRYWLGEIYKEHGVHSDPHLLDKPEESMFCKPELGWLRLAMAVRYLRLELYDFSKNWEWVAHKMIVKRLDVKSPEVAYRVIELHGEAKKSIKFLRNKFGAHIDWPLNRVREEVDRVGLASIVLHGKKVLMFQDAAYRAIPHKYHRVNPWNREFVKPDLPQGDPAKLKDIAEKYEGVDIKLGTDNTGNTDKQHAILASYFCLCLSYGRYLERLHSDNSTMDGIIMTTSEIYNLRYVILEVANITKELADAGLDMPFEPEFASRQKKYWNLRGDYAAHLRPNRLMTLMQVLEAKKELLSHLPHDIKEIDQVMAKLEKAFPEDHTREITHMTGAEMEGIEAELNTLRESTHAAFGNRFIDPHEEQRRRDAKERLKSMHGLEGGGTRRAQAGHGTDGGQGAADKRAASPLRDAEDTVREIGLGKCPEAWKDDLVCGDYAGALARMRLHSALSRAGRVEAMPEGPAGYGGKPDMAVETVDGKCWIAVCPLDNVPRLLGSGGHARGAARAIARDILEAAHARLAGMGECHGQVVVAVMDPDGAIGAHGGLEGALEMIGREMPWVGAVAVVGGDGCEVRGVQGARMPLGERARAMLRGLGEATGGR